ncbi:cellulase family glycosylhydrolase [bacterium]|nr:cellulase family glycosylhydrolase [bacterium]
MTKRMQIFLLLLIGLSMPLNAFVHASGRTIVDAEGNPVLRRGMGLGGWLVPEGYMLHTPGFGSPTTIREQIVGVVGETIADQFYELYHQNYVTREDILQLGEWGFDHIRMPFHYKMFSPVLGEWDDWGFEVTDSLLAWCTEANMHLVLDMHCAPGGQNGGPISDSDGTARLWLEESNKVHTVAIWSAIAERYVDEPMIGGYDLLNEPVLPEGVTGQDLRALYVRIRDAVREFDNNHIIFIEGNWYATDFSGLTPPFDVNMSYSFHKYWSVNNQASIQTYINLRGAWNVPIWMGESGENSNAWFCDAIELFEAHDIGWCWWTHKKITTITSPHSAPMAPGFQQLINYWNGSVEQPSVAFATAALMSQAENLRTENCIYRPGVIPSLFDPEFGVINKPVKNHSIPGDILAADYDLGCQGIAYSDADWQRPDWQGDYPWNRGYNYRNDGVDLEDNDGGNIPNVGFTEAGEWMKYTFVAEYNGIYSLAVEIAGLSAGSIDFYLDEALLTSIPHTPVTGGWQTWEIVNLNDLNISSGEHELKLEIVENGFNIRNMEFILDSAQTETEFPNQFQLSQNYPNPFNGGTTIPLQTLSFEEIKLDIIDLKGRTIKSYTIPAESDNADIQWDGMDHNRVAVPAGVYVYRGVSGEYQQSKKMIYLP